MTKATSERTKNRGFAVTKNIKCSFLVTKLLFLVCNSRYIGKETLHKRKKHLGLQFGVQNFVNTLAAEPVVVKDFVVKHYKVMNLLET